MNTRRVNKLLPVRGRFGVVLSTLLYRKSWLQQEPDQSGPARKKLHLETKGLSTLVIGIFRGITVQEHKQTLLAVP